MKGLIQVPALGFTHPPKELEDLHLLNMKLQLWNQMLAVFEGVFILHFRLFQRTESDQMTTLKDSEGRDVGRI